MKTSSIILLAGVVWFGCLSPACVAGNGSDSARTSIGLRGGFPVFSGDWNKVRYYPDVNLFKAGITFGGDIDVHLSNRLTLAFDYAYEALDGSDWESVARSQGDTLKVTASFGYGAVLLRPHFKPSGPDIVRVEFGPALVFRSGRETLNGRTYNYDFFNSVKFGGEAGIEYDRMISDYMALLLNFRVIAVPGGVSYADEETRAIIALPITVGIRFFM